MRTSKIEPDLRLQLTFIDKQGSHAPKPLPEFCPKTNRNNNTAVSSYERQKNEQLFFQIEVNSGSIFTEPRSGEVNIPKATIHRD